MDVRLKQASSRITELEESLTGKQTALAQLIAENDELKAQIALLSSLDNVVSYLFTVYVHNLFSFICTSLSYYIMQ